MRRKALVCLFCLLTARIAFAIKRASQLENQAIQEQIIAANRLDNKVKGTVTDFEKAKNDKFSPDEIRRLEKAKRRAEDEQLAAYTKAIHMTILAYDLEPPSRQGTSAMPLTKGRSIMWLPVAREAESRQIQDAHGEMKRLPQPRNRYSGVTYPDGVTYIDPKTVRKGVGVLASTLLHERTHFEQFTTAGRGDKMSYREAEVESLQAEKDNAPLFFDPEKDQGQISEIETWLADAQAKVRQEEEARKGLNGLIRRILPSVPPPETFESRLHTDEELAAIKKRAEELRALVEEETRRRHGEALYRIAVKLCAIPSNGHNALAEAGYLSPEGYLPPKAYSEIIAESDFTTRQTGCAENLHRDFLRLLAGGGRLDPGWMETAATRRKQEEYEAQAGPVGRALQQMAQDQSLAEHLRKLRTDEMMQRQFDRYVVETLDRSRTALREFAVSACADPAQIAESDIETFNRGHEWLSNYGPYHDFQSPDAVIGDLEGCPKELLSDLLGDPRRVSLEWARARSAEIAGKHRPRPVYNPGSPASPSRRNPIILPTLPDILRRL